MRSFSFTRSGRYLLIILLVLNLGGCGQKGGLTRPEQGSAAIFQR